jgi:WD40 repeat protein
MVELENGNLITSGSDKLIIIWEKNEAGFYEGKETITEENIVKKLVALKNNKFGYTADDGVLKIMAKNQNKTNNEEASANEDQVNKEGETKNEENENDGNENQTGYKKICELKRHTGKINCMCQLKNEYLFTGGANVNKNKDHHIIVWKPDGENGYIYSQTLTGHKVDISDIIQLKDGRVASSSKDRTIIIWKPTFENDDKNTVKYVSDEILTEYTHGMYGLLELKDSRICTITSNNSLIFWRKSGSLPYC